MSKIKWEEQQKFKLNEIIPPPYGEVYIGYLGTVVMSEQTFDELAEEAELGKIRAGRTGEE